MNIRYYHQHQAGLENAVQVTANGNRILPQRRNMRISQIWKHDRSARYIADVLQIHLVSSLDDRMVLGRDFQRHTNLNLILEGEIK